MNAQDEMIVVVRDRSSVGVLQLVDAARDAGCRVGLVTPELERTAADRLRPAVDGIALVTDPTDPAEVAEAARRFAEGRRRLGAVLAVEDGVIVAAAEAAELLGVGCTPARPLASARNKFTARDRMRSAGLPVPRYALLGRESDVPAVAERVGLPAVVKPVNGAGSHLVRRVTSVPELAEAYRMMAGRMRFATVGRLYHRPLDCGAYGMVDPTTTFLVEGLLRGREFCVDQIVRDGVVEQIGLVDKCIVDEKFFEFGMAIPPLELAPDRERSILAATAAAAGALGLDNTVSHVEVIDDETLGPTIVEINAGRPGGGSLPILYDMVTGIKTAAELVGVARGAPPPRTPPQLTIPIATITLLGEESGRVRALHGLDDLYDLPDVLNVIPLSRPGDTLSVDHETFTVILIVAGFQTTADLRETYEQAKKLVRLELEPL